MLKLHQDTIDQSIISSSEKEIEQEEIEEEEDLKDSKSNGKTKKGDQNEGEYKKLDMNNKGMLLLLKMGWTQGSGLGMMNDGRKDPIPTPAQTPLLGLGKSTQDQYMLSNAINKPKELESIVISKETQEDKIKREEKVKVLIEREEERGDRLKTFHCSICDKGYANISQFEEHERSYAHHHARRALEAKQAKKSGNESIESKREKERKREEKELKRMAKAVGINVTVEPPSNQKPIQETQQGVKPITGNKGTFKSMGFKPVSGSEEVQPPKKMGFKPIGSSSSSVNTIPSSSTPAPTFVISSTKSTSFQSTIEAKNPEAKNPDKELSTIESKPNPGSKFAQIAARLAARRLENGNAKGTSDVRKKLDSCNELERMLEDGTI